MLLNVGFDKGMTARRIKAEDMEIHVKSEIIRGEKILKEDVFHSVVNIFLYVVGIAPNGVGFVSLQRSVALLVKKDAHRPARFITKINA